MRKDGYDVMTVQRLGSTEPWLDLSGIEYDSDRRFGIYGDCWPDFVEWIHAGIVGWPSLRSRNPGLKRRSAQTLTCLLTGNEPFRY